MTDPKERPVLMSAPMVRAILQGTKTQTRRITKPDGKYRLDQVAPADGGSSRCPYGQPGDRLWVRETWQAFFDDEVPADRPRGPRHTLGQPSRPDRKSFVFYKADGPGPVHPDGYQALWRSPLHLPRKYSRITLEITGVRVERLQDISTTDAWAEGIPGAPPPGVYIDRIDEWVRWSDGVMREDPKAAYRALWEQINGPGSWDANPWVWVITFRRITP